jgi:hypothetical protein
MDFLWGNKASSVSQRASSAVLDHHLPKYPQEHTKFTEMHRRKKSLSFSMSNETATRQSTRPWVPSTVSCFDASAAATIEDGNVHPSIPLTGGPSNVAEGTGAAGVSIDSLVSSTTTYTTDKDTTITRTILAAPDSPRSPKLCACFPVRTSMSSLLSPPSSPKVFQSTRSLLSVKSSPNLKLHSAKQPPPAPASTPVSETIAKDPKKSVRHKTPKHSSLTLNSNDAVPHSPPSPRHLIPHSAEIDLRALGFAHLIRPPPDIVIVVTEERRVIDEM